MLPQTCMYRLLWGFFKRQCVVSCYYTPRGLATKLWETSEKRKTNGDVQRVASEHLPFHNPKQSTVWRAAEQEGGGGCSDTCMMRGAKTKGHEAASLGSNLLCHWQVRPRYRSFLPLLPLSSLSAPTK